MQIPTPPNDSEKYNYQDQNKVGLYVCGLVSFIFLLFGQILFVKEHPSLWGYFIFILLLTFYLTLSYSIGFFGQVFDKKKHQVLKQAYPPFQPTIDIFLPSCGEERVIIYNTLKHVSGIEYPKDLIKVYVADDSKDINHNIWLEGCAKDFGFFYLSRPNKGELKKAGNIRYAFAKASGDFFLILDADFAPSTDILREMVPYMREEKIAIVQTPQFFEIQPNDPWIQKGATYVQELFYRLIQVSRQTWNGSICVGTCALYRREALAPHGGTAAIGYSEDVHTGFQAICDGWLIRYLPINLAKGVCPDQVVSFLVQQYRWATGSITLFLNKDFWKAPISKMTKLNYLSGMLYYIATALGLIFVPIPGLLMLFFYPENVFYYNVIFSIPSFIYGTCAIGFWTKAPWGLYAIQARQLGYWAHFLAIWDKLRNQTVGWIATGDKNLRSGSSGIYNRFIFWFLFWNILTIGSSLITTIWRMHEFGIINFLPSLFFSLFNGLIFFLTLKNMNLTERTGFDKVVIIT